MTIKNFVDTCVSELSLYPNNEAKAIAFRVLQDLFSIKSYKYISDPQEIILTQEKKESEIDLELTQIISRLKKGEPVQYVVGFEHFCSHKFKVGAGVLIPRPETEELVKLVIEELNRDKRDKVLLDICTGSGCIAWSIFSQIPYLKVFGCDISDLVLDYAANQPIEIADTIVNGAKPTFFKCDILSSDSLVVIDKNLSLQGEKKVDVIVSNPPYIANKEKVYIRNNVLDYEPSIALFVEDEEPLKFYNSIGNLALKLLSENGKLFFECNEHYCSEVATLLNSKGFSRVKIIKDIFTKDRFVFAQV